MKRFIDQKATLEILNRLGPLYHTYFGFRPSVESDDYAEHYSSEPDDINWYQDNCGNVQAKESGEALIHCFIDDMFQLANNNVVSFTKVIIKYQEDTWYSKEKSDWFNKPSDWWSHLKKDSYLRPYILPYLKSRSYIKVVKPLMEVKISSRKKGAGITIDDILFATRALMKDDTRTIDDGYKVLSSDSSSTLVLEPIADNFST